jgi:hypothetical protein
MAKAMIRTLPLLVAFLVPLSARAQIGVSVNVDVPPPIVFSAPPEVVALPDTNVYVVPDVEADIYFSRGWWWRPWQGRWYRSRDYDRGWGFYRSGPPPFYRRVPPGWRSDYREHRWQGREWNHQRVPHGEMQRNWRGWERDRHWQQPHPGAQGMRPRPVGPGPRPMPMRGPAPMRGPEPMHARGPGPGGGRGFQPGQQGPRPGGPPGGVNRGTAPARSHENRGGHGRR